MYMEISHWLMIYIIALLLQQKRYIMWLPTIPIYPSNKQEIIEVRNYMNRRTDIEIQKFKETDENVSSQFVHLVHESEEELRSIATSMPILLFVYGIKCIFNRARPYQIDGSLDVLKSETADTPAYPSGHALQSYYLAKVLSRRYPDKKDRLYQVAEDCAISRVYAGLHYPSDNQLSLWLVENVM